MIHDKLRVEDLDSGQEDHSVDAVRYWLMYLWIDRLSFSDVSRQNKTLNKMLDKPEKKQFFKKSIDKKRNKKTLEWYDESDRCFLNWDNKLIYLRRL